jgi:phosphohistidine phosphatase SixA
MRAFVKVPQAWAAAILAAITIATVMACGAGAAPNGDPTLARALQRGGLVLAIRHAATDDSMEDQPRVVLSDCRTQRNLSGEGRAEARTIRRGVDRLRLRIGTVLASAFCRTRETARLAFGRFRVSPALLNTFYSERDPRWQRQIRAARRLFGTRPAPGTLTVLVTHGSVIEDATGHSLEEGETIVYRPLGSSRFRLVGRIHPSEWTTLRGMQRGAR